LLYTFSSIGIKGKYLVIKHVAAGGSGAFQGQVPQVAVHILTYWNIWKILSDISTWLEAKVTPFRDRSCRLLYTFSSIGIKGKYLVIKHVAGGGSGGS
jgi:hypothetical protein